MNKHQKKAKASDERRSDQNSSTCDRNMGKQINDQVLSFNLIIEALKPYPGSPGCILGGRWDSSRCFNRSEHARR